MIVGRLTANKTILTTMVCCRPRCNSPEKARVHEGAVREGFEPSVRDRFDLAQNLAQPAVPEANLEEEEPFCAPDLHSADSGKSL